MPADATSEEYTQTWEQWLPAGWSEPPEEEWITRDELLRRARELGTDIHPRTLQILEANGLVPRPRRRWREGAVRAWYAPWCVDLVVRAYERRRGRWPIDRAREDVRGATDAAIFTYNMDQWGGQGIPAEFMRQLRALADRQTQLKGKPIQSAEIRFLDDDGNPVATLRQPLDHVAS